MDLRKGTKTPGEREDEEAERLVRPSPKIKPPRRDLRREDMHVDKDPDKKPDKDLSKNFKDIGGSVATRVLERWARKTDPEMERRLRERVQQKNQKVKVRSKGTGKNVSVSKDRLSTRPDAYEEVKDQPKSQ